MLRCVVWCGVDVHGEYACRVDVDVNADVVLGIVKLELTSRGAGF